MKKQTFVRTSFRLLQRRVHHGAVYCQSYMPLERRKFNASITKEGWQK